MFPWMNESISFRILGEICCLLMGVDMEANPESEGNRKKEWHVKTKRWKTAKNMDRIP